MQTRVRLMCVLLALATPMMAQDVSKSVGEARGAIDARRFDTAARLLDAALASSSTIPESERAQALTAMHFYAAVAYSGLGNDAKTKEHVAAVLDLSPDARIDSGAKYDRRFIATFNEVAAARREAGTSFDQIYPGFAKFQSTTSSADADSAMLRDSIAVAILGTRSEKRAWDEVMPPAERTRFIESFWRRRDRTPGTPENEFRRDFEIRVAFADVAFIDVAVDSVTGLRGALSDRGKVFALLGPPAVVRRRPLTNRDVVFVLNEFVNGAIELWGYQREQLPIAIPKPSVQYRFVNQKGIGDYVMQKEDAYAIHVLQSAGAPKPD